MKTFLNWVEEVDKGLLAWAEENRIGLTESGLRTGVKPQYPDAYARAQYPDAYFPPISATAYLDIQNAKKFPSKAPPDNAP